MPMKKGLRLMANFDVRFMQMQCYDGYYSPKWRQALVGTPDDSMVSVAAVPPTESDNETEPAPIAPDPLAPVIASATAQAVRDTEDLAAQTKLLRGAGGVSTGGKIRSPAEAEAAKTEIKAKASAARKRWMDLAAKKDWCPRVLPLRSAAEFGPKGHQGAR